MSLTKADSQVVVLSATDIGLGNVTNESKTTMFNNPTFGGTGLNGQLTYNAFTSSLSLTIGPTVTNASSTTNISTGALTGSFTKTINIGTGGTTGSTTAINIGSSVGTTIALTGTVTGLTSSSVGLGNVTNESKATMFSSPTFTGTVSGVTKSMVGLGNVENTALSTWPGSSNITTIGTVTSGSAPASDVYSWAKEPSKPTYTAAEVGLGNVTNQSKATMFNNPSFTGDVTFNSYSIIRASAAVQFSTDTQTDIDISDLFYASTSTIHLLKVSVTGVYENGIISPTVRARLTKTWHISVHYNGTAYTLVGGAGIATYSDSASFPAGTGNANNALIIVSGSTVALRLVNFTGSKPFDSRTYWGYSIERLWTW